MNNSIPPLLNALLCDIQQIALPPVEAPAIPPALAPLITDQDKFFIGEAEKACRIKMDEIVGAPPTAEDFLTAAQKAQLDLCRRNYAKTKAIAEVRMRQFLDGELRSIALGAPSNGGYASHWLNSVIANCAGTITDSLVTPYKAEPQA